MKKCTKCGLEKPFSDFSKDSRGLYGLQSKCKNCFALAARAWRETNAERKRAADRAYRENNLEKVTAKDRAWKYKNKSRLAAHNVRWRGASLKAMPEWADLEKIALVYEEAQFASEFFGIKFNVDHIVPLRSKLVCGLHCEANLQVMRATENAKKGSRYWPDMP